MARRADAPEEVPCRELGLKNIVELLNGKTNLLKAQQNLLQAKYTTILNLQLLRFYQGDGITI